MKRFADKETAFDLADYKMQAYINLGMGACSRSLHSVRATSRTQLAQRRLLTTPNLDKADI